MKFMIYAVDVDTKNAQRHVAIINKDTYYCMSYIELTDEEYLWLKLKYPINEYDDKVELKNIWQVDYESCEQSVVDYIIENRTK